MLYKLSRTYIYLVLIVVLASATTAIALQIHAFTGLIPWLGVFSEKLLVAAFLTMLPAICLAKDRNVWKNEFADSPWWMKALVVISCIYGILAMFVSVVIRIGPDPVSEEVIPISAFTFGFDMMCLCILGSILWSKPLNGPEAVKRATISVVATVLLAGFLRILNP